MKRRSKIDFGQIYSGDKQGINVGLDCSLFIRQETTPRQFIAPRVGTAGKSTSDATPSTDISAGTDNALKVQVDAMTAPVDVTLTVAGKNTGALIATELETKINDALLVAGRDERVFVEFTGGLYVVESQNTGTTSAVVITDASSNNVADDLKLGVANSGVEAVGTNDQDALLHTTGGATYNQPIEANAHRSGRFISGVYLRKKVAEFDFDTYINMSGSAGDSIDTSIKLLWKNLLGTESNTGSAIRYTQGLPNFYFSMVKVSTIFAEYYTGAYVRGGTLTAAGDAPPTMKWTGKACKATIAGIAKIPSLVSSSATITVTSGEEDRFTASAPVMVVSSDGRTILYGFDGSLTVSTVDSTLHQVTLSSAISCPADSYLTYWHPGACQITVRDNIFTDLYGSFKMRSTGSAIDVSNVTLDIQNNHVDFDAYFGKDANAGQAPANRCEMNLSVQFDLSNENFGDIVKMREFGGFTPEFIIGSTETARKLKITAAKWIPSLPSLEVPESGTTQITAEGRLLESASGKRDPIVVSFE
jgi:hypothetical protein